MIQAHTYKISNLITALIGDILSVFCKGLGRKLRNLLIRYALKKQYHIPHVLASLSFAQEPHFLFQRPKITSLILAQRRNDIIITLQRSLPLERIPLLPQEFKPLLVPGGQGSQSGNLVPLHGQLHPEAPRPPPALL